MIMNNIAFPKLGISLNISPVAFSIGSKPIYWYALIILSGFLLGLFFVYKTCEKRGVKKDNVWDIALFGLIFGIIGARIYYVLFALDEFDSIADMFKVWNGGLAIYGGIIGAIISTVIYCKVMRKTRSTHMKSISSGFSVHSIARRKSKDHANNIQIHG